MLIIIFRTLILYLVVMFVMRLMGKRQIGQLQPFELVIAILVSELAAIPMQNTGIPLFNGIISILTLLFAQITISFITLKSIRARAIICGKPSILIENGKIMQDTLRREMYSINDLMEQLRSKNIYNIADVEFAILETNGQVSVIPKSQKRAVSPEDLNIPTDYEGLPYDLIIDGEILEENLQKANRSRHWLLGALRKQGIKDVKDVFFATLDSNGKLYVEKKNYDMQAGNNINKKSEKQNQ